MVVQFLNSNYPEMCFFMPLTVFFWGGERRKEGDRKGKGMRGGREGITFLRHLQVFFKI